MARTPTGRTAPRRPTTTNLAKGRGMSRPDRPAPGRSSGPARPTRSAQPAGEAGRRWPAALALGGEHRSIPAWPWIVGLVLCLLGLAAASYLTVAHYVTGVTLACPDTGLINCEKVTTSSYSTILGIPVAVLGLAFFVFMLPLQTPWAWRSTNQYLRIVRMASCVVGMGFVLWLLYAELIKIGNICLYCTSVHALTFLILLSTAFGTIATAPSLDDGPEGSDGSEGQALQAV